MLKGVDPLLGPDLLAALRAMGHGDEIVVADANFPAASCARRLIRLDGVGAVQAVEAILSVLPLDSPPAACTMAPASCSGDPPAVVQELAAALRAAAYHDPIESLERFAFYERSRAAYAIVASGERRFWGNLILRKGALPPPAGSRNAD